MAVCVTDSNERILKSDSVGDSILFYDACSICLVASLTGHFFFCQRVFDGYNILEILLKP